jgi:hypothetical protein
MAHRVLFLTWGRAVGGRERRALEVFNDAVALLCEMEGGGLIERFDCVMLDPNNSMEGFLLVHATGRQIAALREDHRFRALMLDGGLVTRGLRERTGSSGEGIVEVMPLYEEAVARAPGSAR